MDLPSNEIGNIIDEMKVKNDDNIFYSEFLNAVIDKRNFVSKNDLKFAF